VSAAASPLARFPWPAPGGAQLAAWTERGFEVDGESHPVLAFDVGGSGWNDELTTLHEGATGADHPIDVASRGRALRQVRAHLPPAGVVLEVGCSSGYMLRDLREGLPHDATVIGSDFALGPLLALARAEPTIPLLRFDLTRCPLPDACVDVVVALNVLEHIEDDRAAASELARLLRPGGAAVIELPAGPRLYDAYDKGLLHFRRYTQAGARALFEAAGLRVVDESHIGFFVFPAFALVKLRNKRHLGASRETLERMVAASITTTRSSRWMRATMELESHLGEKVSYPFGIRCVLTAIKG
jgi:SAM-dependent methyltransferase